ncbi:GDSL esterase/lipase At5g18430-like [Triticum aestivum]|uniref:GDSL esterase/lipase At5g18430-like n=1 Tax=Triticum aestivum TaxID=4565 RepID=UPI001D02308A|nr:GDSL esterase/lipase At5g18430-like [Triticum aestivum]
MKGGVVVLLGLVVVGAVATDARAAGLPVVPAMFVLGASTLDVGNNNHLPGKDVPRADHPFYGIDFPGGARATGRFSNGYNIADFVARQLGFERSPLAYLELKSRNYLIPSALKRGVNYASAGAGILDSTVSHFLLENFEDLPHVCLHFEDLPSFCGQLIIRHKFARNLIIGP